MSFDLKNIAVYLFGLFILLLALKLFKKPLIWAGRLLLSCAAGALLIVVFNLIMGAAGVKIALNPFNILTTGVFGVPGIAVLWLLTVAV
ncbi:MAG TPA: pro-sigmaK processing inhibitor BofA family protein [Candidatus Monoglobus merdigallinarum]|uniref:Pro-sigmaK processing inhibitor BofA family protein n=1 Tax=Candidatus Monoglobus merdigallinarum TaxID=2838698 RepID=A0A9D1PQ51_9FIRM|nr:pro-sigmaK processing inhibitor BofA family protein [Candidatus Monoglobus merdigallinarum]